MNLYKPHAHKLVIAALLVLFPILGSGCASFCTNQSANEPQGFSVAHAKGCVDYSPASNPLESIPILLHAETHTENGISVTAAVLSDYESRRVFGVELANDGIQPIWIKIENQNDYPITLLHVAIDPGYFSPNEASYMNYTFAHPVNDLINDYFDKHGMKREIAPRGKLEGFVHARWDPGYKYINVTVYGDGKDENFVFYFEIPGLRTDYKRRDWDTIYPAEDIVEYDNEEDLRKVLESIPCCTGRKDGSGENDPLNFIIIGDRDYIFSAFMRRGWDVTETINIGSGWRAAKAFFSGARYRTSPMSSLFFLKRSQDVGLQKARSTIHERNHLRLWILPMRYKGKEVWIGAISRDVGSYLTIKTPWLTAHAIDPDLDEARSYLEQDLMLSGGVEKFGYVRGFDKTTVDEPGWNFMSQPWWSNGLRSVFQFGDDPTTITSLKFFDWEWPGEDGEEIIDYIRRYEQNKLNKD